MFLLILMSKPKLYVDVKSNIDIKNNDRIGQLIVIFGISAWLTFLRISLII